MSAFTQALTPPAHFSVKCHTVRDVAESRPITVLQLTCKGMTKDQLQRKLAESQNLLPQEILPQTNAQQLANILIEIFEEDRERLETDRLFQHNYLELVNYLLVANLNRQRSGRSIFETSFLDNVLALPEAG